MANWGRSINVFVSSDMTELEHDREIVQQALLEMNANPILFELAPAMSSSPADAYLDEVRHCDIFVLLLWKSLRPAVLEEYSEAIKRNKPILMLVKSLVGNEERDPELKDLLETGNAAAPWPLLRRTVYKHYRRVQELRRTVLDSVSAEIARFYADPIHTLSRQEMYELGTSIVRSSHARLYVYEKSPGLILGARGYLESDDRKHAHEKEFVDILRGWIEQNKSSTVTEFTYLFSAESTRAEIAENGLAGHATYVSALKKRVLDLMRIEETTGRRFRVSMVDVAISGPLIVGDDRYAMWLLGGDDAVSISQYSSRVCDVLVRILKAHSQRTLTSDQLLSVIGIS